MQEREMAMATSLYRTDFPAWAYQQAALLKDRKFDQVDWDDLIEEIEDMGNRYHDRLLDKMKTLIAHLLKWQFQPERQGNSWRNTIRTQRDEIPDLFEDMPSLKTDLDKPEWLQKAWQRSVKKASVETYKPVSDFPQQPIWTVEQILDENFFPSAK